MVFEVGAVHPQTTGYDRGVPHTNELTVLDPRTGDVASRTRVADEEECNHCEHVHRHVQDAVDKGATVLTGGQPGAGPGSFYPPTVLTGCGPDMLVFAEETFGPVAPVRVVDDFETALAEAARDRYGLAATVLTPNMARAQAAWRTLPVGTVKINAVFGGAPGGASEPRRTSGSGFGFGPELLDEMTAVKVVHWTAPAGS